MGFRQILGGCTPQKYLTDGVPSNIWGVYSPQMLHGTISVKCFGGVDPPNISRMGFRGILGGSTAPKYLTDGVPSNIWGLYTPKIFDGWGSVKYLGPVDPQNISRNPIREIFWGCRPPKYFTDGVPSNIWGCTPQKYLTDGVPSNISGVYSPQILRGTISVKCFGGVDPPNISRMGFRGIFGGSTAPKYLTDGVPSNIWGL